MNILKYESSDKSVYIDGMISILYDSEELLCVKIYVNIDWGQGLQASVMGVLCYY